MDIRAVDCSRLVQRIDRDFPGHFEKGKPVTISCPLKWISAWASGLSYDGLCVLDTDSPTPWSDSRMRFAKTSGEDYVGVRLYPLSFSKESALSGCVQIAGLLLDMAPKLFEAEQFGLQLPGGVRRLEWVRFCLADDSVRGVLVGVLAGYRRW